MRKEIASALDLGLLVVPALFGGARVPQAAALPGDLRRLSGRQALEITDERWQYDCGRLVSAIAEAVGIALLPGAQAGERSTKHRRSP